MVRRTNPFGSKEEQVVRNPKAARQIGVGARDANFTVRYFTKAQDSLKGLDKDVVHLGVGYLEELEPALVRKLKREAGPNDFLAISRNSKNGVVQGMLRLESKTENGKPVHASWITKLTDEDHGVMAIINLASMKLRQWFPVTHRA